MIWRLHVHREIPPVGWVTSCGIVVMAGKKDDRNAGSRPRQSWGLRTGGTWNKFGLSEKNYTYATWDDAYSPDLSEKNKECFMKEKKDLSPEFFRLCRLLENENRIDNIETPRFSKKITEVLCYLKEHLDDTISLSFVEIVIIGKVLESSKGMNNWRPEPPSARDILAGIFSAKVPLSRQMESVKHLIDANLIYSSEYFGLQPVNAGHMILYGSLTSLIYSDLRPTNYTLALILNDQRALAYYGNEPYLSNVEFLNDWESIMNPTDRGRCKIAFWRHYSEVFQFTNEISREMARISRRLAKTNIHIPFRELIKTHNLTPHEQIYIMAGLADIGRMQGFTNSLISVNAEWTCFISQKALSKDSRLVKLGIFVWVETRFSEEGGEYLLAPETREYILGDAAQMEDRPLLE